MKRKNWIIAGILIAGTITNLSFTSVNSEYSGTSLSNIEALSSGETLPNCFGTGSVDCPTNTIKAEGIVYF